MNNIVNPFAAGGADGSGSAPALAAGAMQEVLASREMAEVQIAMAAAKKYPRDVRAAVDRILNACTRAGLAESALYSYARGGTPITGPSIRLLEAIAQQWGNMQFGVRELERNGHISTAEAYAWDMESNVRACKIFQVSHVRNTKRGSYKLEEERDIYENIANHGARRKRACLIESIPGDVLELAVRQCEVTLQTSADTSAEGIKKMLAAFAGFGVSREQIEKRIQCRIDAMRPAQMATLKKIYTSLRDGVSAVSDWFEVEAAPGASASAVESLLEKTRRAKARIAQSTQPQMPPEILPQMPPEMQHEGGGANAAAHDGGAPAQGEAAQ